ncbi:retron Ec78 anti-phage system effector ATPase PtuA [Vibrio cyclitrophicus]
MKSLSKAIRLLDNNSKKGNISASFQLFETYEDGKDIAIDLSKSKYYFEMCKSALGYDESSHLETPNNKITLEYIDLHFFRKFDHLRVPLEGDITVLIGNNGAGKTTILDAISRTFSWINARIVTKGRNGRVLEDHDVTIGKDENAEVNATFNLGSSTRFDGSLVRPAKGLETPKSSKLENYKNLSNLYRTINSRTKENTNKEINIPLFAFYSVERSNIKSNITFDLEKLSESSAESRFDALDKSVLDGTGNINDFLKWFIFIDNLANSNEIKNLEKLRIESDALKEFVKNESHPLHSILINKNKEIEELEIKIKNSDSGVFHSVINSVKSAITLAVPSVSDIFVDRSSGRAEIRLINENTNININQASKGQHVYISLVADIAKRLIQLNPLLKNPLNGQGIVLIDEIELHLHPEWQRTILEKLTKTFPNIQFIVTTHSPMVLSGIKKNKIRTLGTDSDDRNIATPPLAQSYARTPSEVLETIMYVNFDASFPEKSKLTKYKNLIEQGDFNSEQAESLRIELEEALGSAHEELIRLSMVKRRREKLG